MGCPEAAFAMEELTIVDRHANAPWPYTASVATFGTGTVLAIDPPYRAFAEEHAPRKHYKAMHPGLMSAIVAEGKRRGEALFYEAPCLGFALSEVPDAVTVPDGLLLRFVDQAWMSHAQAIRRFENGVGENGVAARDMRNQFAAVLFEREEPVAVAGAFLTNGLQEVGVDVQREYRGRGLAVVVVKSLVMEILRRGGTPSYACSTTNINSHRTAEACGFVAVCSDAVVSP
jgi:hypothetical protein